MLQTTFKISICAIAILWGSSVFGQSIKLVPSEKVINSGDSFLVQMLLDTAGKKINAISGTIQSENDRLLIADVRYGDSVLSLWPNTPSVAHNAVRFEGGVPGGYSGSDGKVLTLRVVSKSSGVANLSIGDLIVLLHDGYGTPLENVRVDQLSVRINPAVPGVPPKETLVFLEDNEKPEPFSAVVSREESLFDNEYFVSFSAVDKISGIEKYKITESPFILGLLSSLRSTTEVKNGPVVLHYQLWPSKITVTAYDKAGNSSDSATRKGSDVIVLACLVILILVSLYFISRRRVKSRSAQ